FDDAAVTLPALPQAGEGERRRVLAADVEGLFGRAGLLPFVKAVSQHQAAPPAVGRAERRLVGHGLGPGIDEPGPAGGGGRPGPAPGPRGGGAPPAGPCPAAPARPLLPGWGRRCGGGVTPARRTGGAGRSVSSARSRG